MALKFNCSEEIIDIKFKNNEESLKKNQLGQTIKIVTQSQLIRQG